jgi:hypothetical protein
MVLAIPVLQLFLFGYAVVVNVEHIPPSSPTEPGCRRLAYVNAVIISMYFDVVEFVASQAEVIAALTRGGHRPAS